MLLDYFEHTKSLDKSNIEETFDSLRITVKPSIPAADFFPKFFDELKTISTRDTFELFVEIEGTYETVSDSSINSYDKLNKHIKDFSDESEYEIELKVKKNISNNSVSVYFIEYFSSYLSSILLINVINSISRLFNGLLVFEVFSKIKSFGSRSILFIEANTNTYSIPDENSPYEREKKLSLLSDNVTTSNFTIVLLPDDFYLTTKSTYENINIIFRNASSLLSIIFISNASSFEMDGSFSFKISGYKSVSESYAKIDYEDKKCDILYKIYSWSYEGGNSSDKIGLVRNVLSIHLGLDGRIKIDDEVWEAIQSNYQIYLKENVKSYLEIKNKIGEFVIESSSRTYSMADEILSSFKNSVLVFITFLLTVVVVNGLKDTGVKSVFSDVYLAIVIILCIVSLLWREMTTREVKNQFESASSTIKRILEINYSNILMEGEIDQCIDPVISTNREYLEMQVKRYSRWWLGIILVFGLSYMSANIFFEHRDFLKREARDNMLENVNDKNNDESQIEHNKS